MEDRIDPEPGQQQQSTQQHQTQNENNNSASTKEPGQVDNQENDPEKILWNCPNSNIAGTSMALVPYQVDEPQTLLHLQRSSPDSLLNYILNLRQTVDQLVDENKSLEGANKRLKRCLILQGQECRLGDQQQVSQQSILVVAENDSKCSAVSGRICLLQAAGLPSSRDPTSFVSVLAPPPPQDQNNRAGPSQNVSSLNITPEATKPNSLAILPPQALPEPRLDSNEDGVPGVETIRSANVLATEHTGNHIVSSEDISIAVNNSERNSTSRSSEELVNHQEEEDKGNNVRLSVNSTVSTTDIPHNHGNNEQPAPSTTSNNIPGPSSQAQDPPPDVSCLQIKNNLSNFFLSAKSSSGAASRPGNIIVDSQTSSLASVQESSSTRTDATTRNSACRNHHGNIFHPFISSLYSARRGFLQRLRSGFRSRQYQYHPADYNDDDSEMVEMDDSSLLTLSTSWPVSANVMGSTCLSSGLHSLGRGNSTTDHVINVDERRPSSLSSLRTQLYFDAQMFELHRRQLAAGRLLEEPEENGSTDAEEYQVAVGDEQQEDLFRTPLLPPLSHNDDHAAGSRDSLNVNIDSNEIIEQDLIEEIVTGGDDVAVDESSSSSSSAESADGRGDADDAETEPPSLAISLTDQTLVLEQQQWQPTASTAPPPPVQTISSQQKFGTNLGGKYGNLGALFRPRPPSGHRYVISANEVSSRRRNETRLPSWVPTYAQRIECILHQVLDEVENPICNSSSTTVSPVGGPGLNFVYARLRGEPPMRLLEFDQSSDSEDSCIRSINSTSTKQKKSCLKVISREGNVGESRPKNLSWSQHVYVAQIPAMPVPYGDYDKNKTKSCPGIYYMGEFKIHNGQSLDDSMGKLEKYGRSDENGFQGIVRRLCHCLRCNSPPPQHVQSTMDVRSGDGLCSNPNKTYTCHDATTNSVNVARDFQRLNFKWRRKKREGKVFKKQKK